MRNIFTLAVIFCLIYHWLEVGNTIGYRDRLYDTVRIQRVMYSLIKCPQRTRHIIRIYLVGYVLILRSFDSFIDVS